MPMSVTTTSARGRGYADIRVGECQVHQVLLDVSALTGVDDADNYLPPGLPIRVDGTPVGSSGQTVFGLIGPEPVYVGGTADIFGNCFISGVFNRDMIEDNLGRSLSSDELDAIDAAPSPMIKLI